MRLFCVTASKHSGHTGRPCDPDSASPAPADRYDPQAPPRSPSGGNTCPRSAFHRRRPVGRPLYSLDRLNFDNLDGCDKQDESRVHATGKSCHCVGLAHERRRTSSESSLVRARHRVCRSCMWQSRGGGAAGEPRRIGAELQDQDQDHRPLHSEQHLDGDARQRHASRARRRESHRTWVKCGDSSRSGFAMCSKGARATIVSSSGQSRKIYYRLALVVEIIR